MENLNELKNTFIDILNANVSRPGLKQFITWLEKTDFFTAPASTRYHLCEEGGLVKHSLDVYWNLVKEVEMNPVTVAGLDDAQVQESVAICALLHDLCKANYYKVEKRNRKNDKGQWESYDAYTVDDAFPMGHGEKSVYLIERFMKLKPYEAVAVRWHMGGFDDAVKGGSFSIGNAYEKYPFALALHIADMKSTYYDEVER